jgi:hypothetical protein
VKCLQCDPYFGGCLILIDVAELRGCDILDQDYFGQFVVADPIVVALTMEEPVGLLDRSINVSPKAGRAQDRSDASGPIGPIIFIKM